MPDTEGGERRSRGKRSRDPEMPKHPHSSVQSALRREWTSPMRSPITFTHPPRELPLPRTCWFGPCLSPRLLRLMWPLNLLLSPIRDPDIAPIRPLGWRATTSALIHLVPLTTMVLRMSLAQRRRPLGASGTVRINSLATLTEGRAEERIYFTTLHAAT